MNSSQKNFSQSYNSLKNIEIFSSSNCIKFPVHNAVKYLFPESDSSNFSLEDSSVAIPIKLLSWIEKSFLRGNGKS